MPSFLRRISSEAGFSLMLALACVAVVVWMRAVPSSLPAAEGLADKMIERELRQRIAPQVVRQVPAEQARRAVDDAAREWIERNPKEVAAARVKLMAQIQSEISFIGDDGRSYAYLGDYDSYVWLRNARNYLRHGTTCDAVVGGECRDTYGNAPVGSRMIYNRSLHVAAIVALHRFIALFKSDFPLAASAFLVPIIVGALGVLPAFFVGRRFGGNVAAVVAALTVSLDGVYLIRSAGSDNDVWNVVMPLYIAWAVVTALNERSARRAAAAAFVAALLTGLYAAIWRGWLFTYVVVLCAALGCSTLTVVRRAQRRDFRRVWAAPEVRAVFSTLAIYCLASGVFISMTETSTFYAPFRFFNSSLQGSGSAIRGLWPVALMAVSELGKPLAIDVAQFMGGLVFFFLGWLGLLSLILPEARLKTRHIALAAWILALFAVRYYLFAAAELPRSLFVLLFAGPLAAELLIRAVKNEPPPADEAAVVLVVVWFFASLEQVYGGIRFLILFTPPFALALGALAGRVRVIVKKLLDRPLRRHAALAAAVSSAVALSIVLYPLQRGYTTMRDYYPEMNDAWWDSLVKIKNESTPDAIVNSWWDYGYWVKYAAERRVTSDGGSLTTHVPHWLAKAFVAPSDEESRGILRMLDCGSDATPLPEGRYGALGKLNAMGLSDYRAYGFLTDLIKLDRTTAMRYLAERGFSADRQATLLAATHCGPPPAFFVVSKEMITKGEWWMGLGSWDVRRAYLAKRTRQLPEAQAVEDLARLGYRAAEAKALYDIVGRLKTEADIDEFIAPAQRLIPTEWIPCREAENEMTCQISITNIEGVSRFEFVYDPAAPKNGKLTEQGREAAPAALLVAGSQALDESLDPRSPFPTIGVLLDVAGRRILVGSPLLIRSTLVRLFYLNGRYSHIFKPFERRRTLLDDEVATFKIDWGE